MNLLLDTLKSRRSFLLLGHGLALPAALGLLALQGWAWRGLWPLAGAGLAWLAAFELAAALLDRPARRLRAMAGRAFPFKDLPADERAFLQRWMMRLPKAAAARAGLAWLGLAALWAGLAAGWEAAAAALGLGLPLAAIALHLGMSVMTRRVAPFYYFEQGYADAMSDHLPSLSGRLGAFMAMPLLAACAFPLLASLLGMGVAPPAWAWLLLWAGAALLACRAAAGELAVSPLKDLGAALSRFEEGDHGALLDVTSGDEIGQATERFNKALRAADKRLFIQENFGHMVPRARMDELFEGGLKMDGEERELAVLALRLKGPYTLAAFNRLCQAFAGSVDKFGGGLDLVGDGIVSAVFGAPFKVQRLPDAALACAWELAGLCRVFCAQQKMQKGLALDWGLGAALGRASVGLAGPKARQRYTAFGTPGREALELSLRDGAHLNPALAAAAGGLYKVDASGRLLDGPVPENPLA